MIPIWKLMMDEFNFPVTDIAILENCGSILFQKLKQTIKSENMKFF